MRVYLCACVRGTSCSRWDKRTESEFAKHIGCIKDLYSGYRFAGDFVNGNLTIGTCPSHQVFCSDCIVSRMSCTLSWGMKYSNVVKNAIATHIDTCVHPHAGENMADIGGLQIAYAALMARQRTKSADEHRDHRRLFFTAFAQTYCSSVRKKASLPSRFSMLPLKCLSPSPLPLPAPCLYSQTWLPASVAASCHRSWFSHK
jgi:hypothetical protein